MRLESKCERCNRTFGDATWDEESSETYRRVLKMTGYDCLCETCTYIYIKYGGSEIAKKKTH